MFQYINFPRLNFILNIILNPRLSIEKQCLQQYLELITSDVEVLSKRYKDYAFLRDEEKVAPFIKYLLTLSAVPFTCFTASFPNISESLLYYRARIMNWWFLCLNFSPG